jgi:hypothetical protein
MYELDVYRDESKKYPAKGSEVKLKHSKQE